MDSQAEDARDSGSGVARVAGDATALRWSTPDGGTWEGVRLLDADPDLATGLPDAERAQGPAVVVPGIRVARGPWAPPERLHTAIGIVALEGLLVATGHTYGRDDVRLVGPGDTLDARLLADPNVAWRALAPAHLAVLDERFVFAARRWPALLTGLARRLLENQQEQHARAAICTMSRVEERILALLCHLALRWGHVTPDGVTLTLPLTHELLGALIGARRPTVTLALLALTEQRLVSRRDDGTWLLPLECRDWPTTGIPPDRPPIAA
jgi:hypothetical protein